MKNSETIQYIVKKLREQSDDWAMLNDKMTFEKLFKSDDILYDDHRSSWHNWLTKKMNIRNLDGNPDFKSMLKDFFNLPDDIWSKGESAQKSDIKSAINRYLSPSIKIDFSYLQTKDPEMNKKQEELLFALKNTSIRSHLSECEKYFEKIETNQTFLVELIKLLYPQKEYDLLYASIFPCLLSYNFNLRELQKTYAHTLSSLTMPQYSEAQKILNTLTINNPDDKDIIDIQTALISNKRREVFLSEKYSEDDLILLINYYQALFDKTNHYYPGINLAYMLWLKQFITDTDHSNQIKLIKDKSYKMITEHKNLPKNKENKNTIYYASTSEVEFNLLLNKDQATNLETILDDLSPDPDPIFRTKRQMEQFVRICGKTESKRYLQSAIIVLEDYLQYQQSVKLQNSHNLTRRQLQV